MSGAVIEVYTDGSATKEHLPGGWAFVIVANNVSIAERCGHMERASNNDAELEAAIQGLTFMKEKYEASNRDPMEDKILLISDSQLVLGWATGKYKAKQQRKLEKIQMLRHLVGLLGIETRWIRGHSGNQFNNRCDKLAKRARMGNTDIKPEKIVKSDTKIGHKKKGTLAIRFKGKRFVVDLENMVVEEYDRFVHGHRDIYLQVVSDE